MNLSEASTPAVVTYEFTRSDGVKVRTYLLNGVAQEMREWPGGDRLESTGTRPLHEAERGLLVLCERRAEAEAVSS